MSNALNRNQKLAADQAMIDGVNKFLGNVASLTVGSTAMTPADIVKVFQDRVNSSKAVLTADAARTTAVKADRDKRAQTTAFSQSFRRMVQGMYSQSPDTLATFGLKTSKVAKKTVDTKATAVAKSKATREARGTLGKNQKKDIKGSVTVAGNTSAPATTVAGNTSAPAATVAGNTSAPAATVAGNTSAPATVPATPTKTTA